MTANYSKSKKKPLGKMVLFGICSAIIFGAVLSYQNFITGYFTRGALYAALPIAGAFLISYIHGHFTGYFWSVLGIEAKKSAVVRQKTETKRPDSREHPQS
ncbi:MAG TPA: hypothetical protein DCP92_00880 [Nitrospiraceae bacterium]|nr:hypothetical protein [Nitrospiraceae bacterium]